MNEDQVLDLTVELCMKEVSINKLENKIKRHIETYININHDIEEDKLMFVAKMYNDLYELKNEREKLLTKVAIGYDCIIKDDEN
ncbi:hypothetical protein [Terrisporobacter sp.]|uniref:hypothetical protein n=1 Tax=Terrisporobacter sp. TaxID=1965305 RepID=UPI002604BC1E|nr:hypothetical protein [Terrisporobacter sp.]